MTADRDRGNALLGWVLILFFVALAMIFQMCGRRVVHAQTPSKIFLPAILRDAGPVTTSTTTTTTSSTTSTTLPYPVIGVITPAAFSLSGPGPTQTLTIHGIGLVTGMSIFMDSMGTFPLVAQNQQVATVEIQRQSISLPPGPIDLVCYLMRGETTGDLYFYSVVLLE